MRLSGLLSFVIRYVTGETTGDSSFPGAASTGDTVTYEVVITNSGAGECVRCELHSRDRF
ncbi:MAG TPA: hypothetical protein VLL54_10060 [Pyrinomonadaceae bacterium]|nr:hypothetical protein [Pyrinomonadaceae bacterium]